MWGLAVSWSSEISSGSMLLLLFLIALRQKIVSLTYLTHGRRFDILEHFKDAEQTMHITYTAATECSCSQEMDTALRKHSLRQGRHLLVHTTKQILLKKHVSYNKPITTFLIILSKKIIHHEKNWAFILSVLKIQLYMNLNIVKFNIRRSNTSLEQ